MQVEFINTASALQQICDDTANSEYLALDTEFFRETTYYPELCLVQVATKNLIACIDPQAFDAAPGITQLLTSPAFKILHSCSQDLEVLFQYTGHLPCPLIDTQIAAALTGHAEQIGYARLIEDLFGNTLDKSQTRTDWRKRPLSEKQIQYAADDVRYLIPAWENLNSQLKQLKRDAWFFEDCRQICEHPPSFNVNMDSVWQRVKGIHKLPVEILIRVEAIAQWREQLAMNKNLTRRRVLKDDVVIDLARQETTLDTIADKFRLSDMDKQSLERSLQNASETDPAQWQSLKVRYPTQEQKKTIRSCMDKITQLAEKLQLPAPVLCSRKTIEHIIIKNEITGLTHWRQELLCEIIDEYIS